MYKSANCYIGYCVEETMDSGYIIFSKQGLDNPPVCLIKTDSYGNHEWDEMELNMT